MLTNKENLELIYLLNKIEWPVTPDLFDAICNNLSVNPIDLAVLREGDEGPEIFLIYREDNFFKGWHFPGSVILPGRTVSFALKDIVEREIGTSTEGLTFEFVGFHQFMKGGSFGECPRGQEVDLFHVLFLDRETKIETDESRKFFPISKFPDDILSHHKVLFSSIKKYLECKINT